MTGYVVMHETERGFETPEEAMTWIRRRDNPDTYRICRCEELDPAEADKTNLFRSRFHDQKLDDAFKLGVNAERARLMLLLGLGHER